jgi:spermidine/putrescine transport system permease protein
VSATEPATGEVVAEPGKSMTAAIAQPTWLDRIRARPSVRTAVAAALPVGFATALLFIPYVLLLVQSFWRLKNGAITHQLTLENYQRLFGTELYPDTILFSAGVAIRVTLFSLLLAYPLAYLLAFKVKRHKQLMYMAVIIPLWVSYLVRAYAWKIILGQSGILNGLLLSVGLIHQPLTFLLYSRWAVILALTHIYTPFTLMPIYALLEAIPPSLKEASQDLYASRWQTFRRIILPLSLPGVLVGSTFAFVLSMGDFLAPQLLGGNDSALMVSNLVWSLFGVAYNWPLGAAVSVIVLLLTISLLWLSTRVEQAMNYAGESAGSRDRREVGMTGRGV